MPAWYVPQMNSLLLTVGRIFVHFSIVRIWNPYELIIFCGSIRMTDVNRQKKNVKKSFESKNGPQKHIEKPHLIYNIIKYVSCSLSASIVAFWCINVHEGKTKKLKKKVRGNTGACNILKQRQSSPCRDDIWNGFSYPCRRTANGRIRARVCSVLARAIR